MVEFGKGCDHEEGLPLCTICTLTHPNLICHTKLKIIDFGYPSPNLYKAGDHETNQRCPRLRFLNRRNWDELRGARR